MIPPAEIRRLPNLDRSILYPALSTLKLLLVNENLPGDRLEIGPQRALQAARGGRDERCRAGLIPGFRPRLLAQLTQEGIDRLRARRSDRRNEGKISL